MLLLIVSPGLEGIYKESAIGRSVCWNMSARILSTRSQFMILYVLLTGFQKTTMPSSGRKMSVNTSTIQWTFLVHLRRSLNGRSSILLWRIHQSVARTLQISISELLVSYQGCQLLLYGWSQLLGMIGRLDFWIISSLAFYIPTVHMFGLGTFVQTRNVWSRKHWSCNLPL